MITYPQDPSGTLPSNLITGERQVISPPNWSDFYFIVPLSGPYFRESLQVVHQPSGQTLTEGVDYSCTHKFHDASLACAKPIYGSITFFDKTLAGMVELRYQTLGGPWTIPTELITEILSNKLLNPRRTTWEQIVDLPFQFPVIDHEWDLVDMVGASEVVTAIYAIRDAVVASGSGGLADHLADLNNPHNTTKTHVGLGLVQNYPVASVPEAQNGTVNDRYMTPVRTAQAITAQVGTALTAHIENYTNPHQVTKEQVNLGSVQNYAIASQLEAEAGTLNTRYMTPVRVRDAVTAQVATLVQHVASQNNPHNVTKAQVNLGSVPDYGMATVLEARAGTLAERFMSPLLVREAVQAQVGADLNNHTGNQENPHNTTKTHVGLGLVQNFPIATQTEAREGTVSDRYMTPLRVKEAIDAQLGTALTSHLDNTSNPHNTTKGHVGLGNVQNFPIATSEQAQEGTLDTVYMTALKVAQAIAAQAGSSVGAINTHTTNLNNPHNTTKSQVGLGNVNDFATATPEQAVLGTAADLYMTPLAVAQYVFANVANDLQDFIERVDNPHQVTATQVGAYSKAEMDALMLGKLSTSATAANATRVGGYLATELLSNFSFPAVNPFVDGGSVTRNEGATWTKLAGFVLTQPQNPLTPARDLVCHVIGGEVRAAAEQPIYLLRMSMRSMADFTVEQLHGPVDESQFGYTFDGVTGDFALYMRNGALRNTINVSVVSQPDVMFTNGGVVSETAPAGLVYCASFNHSGLGRSTVGALMFGRNAATSSAAAEGPLVEWVSVANDSTQAAAAALVESTLYREVRDWVTASAYGTDNHSSSIPDLLGWTTPNGFATVVERVAASTTLASLRYPVASSDYSFEVELGSTDEGANTLGVCAAFARVGGKDHGLYALRTPGGLVLQSEAESLPGGDIYKLFSVGYNLLQNDAIDLGSTNTGLVWGDGVADADRGTEGAYTTPFHGWDVAGACRIRVTRAGNLIEIETSQLGETDVALGQSVTIDLTSRPELAVFLGPTTWGLVTYAQAEASFDFISRPGFYEPYVELSVDGSGADTSTVNFYNGASWTSQPLTLASEFIRPGRLYYSPINEQLFFAQRNGNLRRMVLGA